MTNTELLAKVYKQLQDLDQVLIPTTSERVLHEHLQDEATMLEQLIASGEE